MAESIGLYGGSFDPIHFGHLISARSLAEHFDLSRIILIPSASPPHKQGVQLAPKEHRLAMARAAVEDDPLFEVSDIEFRRSGPSYTLDTVARFQEELGGEVSLAWIIGGDSLPDLPTWYRAAELVRCARIITATRPGWRPPDVEVLADAVGRPQAEALLADCASTPGIDISATDIRRRVAEGRSIRYLTPGSVVSHIQVHRLYRENK